MGRLTVTEKKHWEEWLVRAITESFKKVSTEYREEIRLAQEAAKEVLQGSDIHQAMVKADTWKEQIDNLKQEESELEETRKKAERDLMQLAKTFDENVYYTGRAHDTIEEAYRKEVNKIALDSLADQDWTHILANAEERKQQYIDSLMFATSESTLKALIISFAKSFGVSPPAEY